MKQLLSLMLTVAITFMIALLMTSLYITVGAIVVAKLLPDGVRIEAGHLMGCAIAVGFMFAHCWSRAWKATEKHYGEKQ